MAWGPGAKRPGRHARQNHKAVEAVADALGWQKSKHRRWVTGGRSAAETSDGWREWNVEKLAKLESDSLASHKKRPSNRRVSKPSP